MGSLGAIGVSSLGRVVLEYSGDDYHVLKYHDIRYYRDNNYKCLVFVLDKAESLCCTT